MEFLFRRCRSDSASRNNAILMLKAEMGFSKSLSSARILVWRAVSNWKGSKVSDLSNPAYLTSLFR